VKNKKALLIYIGLAGKAGNIDLRILKNFNLQKSLFFIQKSYQVILIHGGVLPWR